MYEKNSIETIMTGVPQKNGQKIIENEYDKINVTNYD